MHRETPKLRGGNALPAPRNLGRGRFDGQKGVAAHVETGDLSEAFSVARKQSRGISDLTRTAAIGALILRGQ